MLQSIALALVWILLILFLLIVIGGCAFGLYLVWLLFTGNNNETKSDTK